MKRCGTIELFRFIAAMSIAIYHFEIVCMGSSVYLPHNYIWVEFYFVLSGFFLARNALQENDVSAWEYVIGQLKKLYPLYLMAFIVCFIIESINLNVTLLQILNNLWIAKWEILMCYIYGGVAAYNGGGAPAYIPVLLICSLVIYFLVRKCKALFVNIIAPISIIVGLGYILSTYGHLSVWTTWGLLFPLGIVRGFSEMSFGVLCYIVFLPLVENKSNVLKGIAIFNGGIAVSALILCRSLITSTDLALYIFVFGLIIMVCYTINLPSSLNNICNFLGKLNYPIFLFHFVVLKIVNIILVDETRYGVKLLYTIVLLILIALIIMVIQQCIRKLKKYKGLKNNE